MFDRLTKGYKNSVILWLVNFRKKGIIRGVADYPKMFYTKYTNCQ